MPVDDQPLLEPRTLWTDVAGSRMHAVAIGAGPPVVLLHGYGVSGTYMLPLARVLGSSFSAFAPDLPGQGKSSPLPGQTTLGSLAAALGSWLEANGLSRPAVVANSMGCQVVTEIRHGEPRAARSSPPCETSPASLFLWSRWRRATRQASG